MTTEELGGQNGVLGTEEGLQAFPTRAESDRMHWNLCIDAPIVVGGSQN